VKSYLLTSLLLFISVYSSQLIASPDVTKNLNNSIGKAIDTNFYEKKWEYLVVTFGETKYSSIESNIIQGDSKLVIFQEFADLLAGHESVELQSKLDILGRFGWEFIDSIGNIRGDQQLMFKRERNENRMEIEQKLIKKLSSILREEGEKKAELLKKYLTFLDNLKVENKPKQEPDKLIELDAFEKKLREKFATKKAEKKIAKLFSNPSDFYLKNTSLTSVNLRIRASEKKKNDFKYSGKIELEVNATDALLFDQNKYRTSEAEKFKKQFAKSLFRKIKPLKKAESSSKIYLYININIHFNDEIYKVGFWNDDINIDGYNSKLFNF